MVVVPGYHFQPERAQSCVGLAMRSTMISHMSVESREPVVSELSERHLAERLLGQRGQAAVVNGAQWGDEGKGKWADLLADHADGIVRYQGGNNAGHTLQHGEETYKLHIIPSGILYPDKFCALGNGVVLDPENFFDEQAALEARGVSFTDRFWISGEAHVIMPYHRALDEAKEKAAGKNGLGTTKRGIGPTYTNKIARVGLRVQDLLDRELVNGRVNRLLAENRPLLETQEVPVASPAEIIEQALEYGERLRPYLRDVGELCRRTLRENGRLILEGAQGTELDIDHGTYPYVTSSNTTVGGALTGIGLGPKHIGAVVGVAKAYTTRVGAGPFPTELKGETADFLQKQGNEFGTTTGRPRRTGWLDLPLLKRSAELNTMTTLGITKLDVLSGLDTIEVCVGYEGDGYPRNLGTVQPIYEPLPGFQEDISQAQTIAELPTAARDYLSFIEREVGVPIDLVGVGPDRDQTIFVQPGELAA